MKKLTNHFLFIFISLAFIFSLIFTYSYIDFGSNMSIGVGHAYTAKSLALSYDFNVDEYWGNSGVDVVTAFDGHKYVAYAPLNAVLMAIPYFILQVFYFIYTKFFGSINGDLSIILESLSLSLPASIFYALTAYLLWKKLLELKVMGMSIVLVVVGFGFGTLFLNYSVSFFNHVPAAFFIFYAYYLISNAKSNRAFLYAGVFTGLAFLTEFPTILFSMSVGIYILYQYKYEKLKPVDLAKRLTYFAIPVTGAIIILGFYNYLHFGSPFLMSEQILYKQNLSREIDVHSFKQNPIYGIWGLYFSPLKGLFLISPFLLFSFWGFREFFIKKKKLAILGVSYVLIISFLYSLWPDCFGATPYGPRYLISVIPFLSLCSAFYLRGNVSYVVYAVLVFWSIFISFSNLLDGLPSGKLFSPTNCQTLRFGSYIKAFGYYENFGTRIGAPMLMRL